MADLPYISGPAQPWSGDPGSLFKRMLPDQGPSPTCLRRGHAWGDAIPGHDADLIVRPCLRCARRQHFIAITEERAHVAA